MVGDDERLLLETVRQVTRERVAPRAAEIDRTGEFPQDIRGLFAELGLLGLNIPAEYGGSEVSSRLFCRVVEIVAGVCVNSSNIITQQDLGAQPILVAGDETQKRRYLPKLANGEFLASFALTEPGAGSDAGGITTRAIRSGDDYVIDGAKRFITWASQADVLTVFARTSGSSGTAGISALLLDRGTPGYSVGRLEDKLGLRASPTAEVSFDGCRVPAGQLLGPEGEGFRIAMRSLNHGRLAIAATSVGIAQGALDFSVEYVKSRTQFGQSIAGFQGIQFLVAERATEIEAARQLLYRACDELDTHGPDLVKLTSMAKLFATDMAMRVTVDAVQLLGGYGYIREFPVERFMREAKLNQIVEGTSQIQKVVIAGKVIGL